MMIERLEQLALTALQQTYTVHEDLDTAGIEIVHKNQFGETALYMDIAAERTVIEALSKADIPIRLISEEHGIVDIGEAPRLLGILDGLDGSSVYASQRGTGRYGTMLSIFSNDDPVYSDYLFCGIMLHAPEPALCFCTKGSGSYRIIHGEKTAIHCKSTTALQNTSLIYIDEYFAINRELFSKHLTAFHTQCTRSSAVHYADVALGQADAALECTRKQNLEIAVAFGLITEANGAMITLDGVSLAQRQVRTFGYDAHIPVVTAATPQLAHEIVQYVQH